jgi:hypothetical protein
MKLADLLVAFVALFCGHLLGAEPARKPKILLIMADDLRGYGGAFTRGVVKTPNLDRLAARGVRFERAIAQNGATARLNFTTTTPIPRKRETCPPAQPAQSLSRN